MMRRLTLILFMSVFVGISALMAQTKTITGTVTDSEDGSPIPGVSIIVKGTTIGTVTDVNGKYSLAVPQDANELLFSFVGMVTQDILIQGRSVIDVTMKSENKDLDEVVVTGLAGATQKKKLSVSVASVSSKQLDKVPAGSAASALQGKVAGVQVTSLGRPGSGATILLRGAANLYGSQAPLVIMDGVYVEGGLSDINVDDIKSIEIVKGASASSLYGSRAGNGVIVITSKRGGVGKTEVTFRSEIGYSELNHFIDVNLSHPYKLASDWENYKGRYTKYEGVTYGPDYASVYAADGPNKVTGTRILEADQYADNPFGVYRDFQKLFFKKGLNNTEYVSINGGNSKVKSFFSYEYNKVDGVIKELEGYNRNTLRFNVDYYITDWLKFSASNTYIRILDHGSIRDFRTITRIAPDANVLYPNPDGQPYYFMPDPWEHELTNPLYNAWNLDALTKQQRFLGGYNLSIKFTNTLNMNLEYSLENNTSRYTHNTKYETYHKSGDPIGFGYSKGKLSKSNSLNLVQKAQATLNFVKQFGDLDVKAKLSALFEDRSYDYYRVHGNHYLYSGIPSLDNFKNEDITASSNQTAERAQDYFAIASLIYKDRYIFDGLYRKDGSSLFGENQRWHDYYRVSAAYRISEDIHIPGVQEMKINVAKGTAGQRPGFTWQYEMTALSHGSLSTNRIKGNPELKPSLTDETEIGFNLFFLNRFTFNFAYSYQESTDQFMLVNLFSPANAGKNRQWQNVGDLISNTYEASLNTKVIKSNNWRWNLNINFTKTESRIEALNVAEQHVGIDGLFLLREGTEFGSMYGYKFVHDLKTMEKQLPAGENISDYSVNSDGVVVKTADIGTPDEKAFVEVDEDGVVKEQKIGNQNPNFFMGIISDLSYKNFDFYMLWDYKNGGDVYNRNTQWNTISGRSAIVDQAGKPDSEKKTVSYYQSLYNVNENMDFWVEDGSYAKLREVSLSYTLRNKNLNNFLNGFFKEFKFSVIGRNVLTFTKYSGWDPEVARYDDGTQQYFSVDYGVYPNQPSYSLSVQLKF